MFGLDLPELVRAAGYLGLFGIVFAESGLLVGFFLPGDSLLFTAGIIASQGYLNIWVLCLVLFAAAVLGDNFGYAFGRRLGPRVFKRENSLFFSKNHITRASRFYEKHGAKTVIIARFVPVVRTFAPILAGVGKMNYRIFVTFNIVGALLWSVGVTLIGYYLGLVVPNIEVYIVPGIVIIIIASIAPSFIQFMRNKEARAEAAHTFRKIGRRLVGRN